MSHILFLSRWLPDPPNNGSKLRILNLLRGLAERHDVTLLSFRGSNEQLPAGSELHHICRRVQTIVWQDYKPHSLRARAAFLSSRPRFLIDTFSAPMQQAIVNNLKQTDFDLVIASQIDMAAYSPAFRSAPAIFEEVEVATLYEQFAHAGSLVERLRYGLTWFKHRHFLRRRLQDFRACTVVSDRERTLLARAVPHYNDVAIVPNGIDTTSYRQPNFNNSPNERLIFTGSLTYEANYEAVTWFLEQIYPRVRQAVPTASLTITGNHGDRPLPSAEGVTLTGFVDDIHELVTGAAVSIAPIRSGGGTRLKILEAMALGTPVVSTSKGAEGLDVNDGEELLLADSPQTFATSVVSLLNNEQLRTKLSNNARCKVRNRYDWSIIMPTFLNLIENNLNHSK